MWLSDTAYDDRNTMTEMVTVTVTVTVLKCIYDVTVTVNGYISVRVSLQRKGYIGYRSPN